MGYWLRAHSGNNYFCQEGKKGRHFLRVNGLVNVSFFTFLSSRTNTAVLRLWRSLALFLVGPAMFLASSASLASSGAIGKSSLRALGLRVIPMRPPETFIERFMRFRAWSAPNAQNDVSMFLLTTQFPCWNSSTIAGGYSGYYFIKFLV